MAGAFLLLDRLRLNNSQIQEGERKLTPRVYEWAPLVGPVCYLSRISNFMDNLPSDIKDAPIESLTSFNKKAVIYAGIMHLYLLASAGAAAIGGVQAASGLTKMLYN